MLAQIKHFGKFITRQPALNADIFKKGNDLGTDSLIDHFISNPLFLEALYLSSKDTPFVDILRTTKDPRKLKKIKYTLIKYINRCCFRCTPFGTSATIGLGEIGNIITPKKEFNHSICRDIRLDNLYLHNIAQHLLKDEFVMKNIHFFTNNSIYKVGEKYRYVEYQIKNYERNYTLSTFPFLDFYEALFQFCNDGKTISEITTYFNNLGYDEADCSDFILELIASKILIDEFEPSIVGESYMHQLYHTLKRLQQFDGEQVNSVGLLVDAIDNFILKSKQLENSQAITRSEYDDMLKPFSTTFPGIESRHFIQVDSFEGSGKHIISEELIQDIKSGMEVIMKFADKIFNNRLISFKNEFFFRYENERKKLVEVLDPELGIGYPVFHDTSYDDTTILDQIPNSDHSKATVKDLRWKEPIDSLLFNKTLDAIRNNKIAIEFNKQDIMNLPSRLNELPATFSLNVSIVKKEDTYLIKYNEIGASSATTMFGRFAPGNTFIEELVKDISSFEEKAFPGQYVAEINHLTDVRVANIASRSRTRRFEIPYITRSNDRNELIDIDINHLTVQIESDVIVIRDADGHAVVPRLSNAHNYLLNTLPLYKFLCDLQESQEGYIQFRVDSHLLKQAFSFIPRISYGRYVLHLATWFLNSDDLIKIFDNNNQQASGELKKYFALKNIPFKFELISGDTNFFINLDHTSSLFLLEQELQKGGTVQIAELLSDHIEDPWDENATGSENQELIIPFKNELAVLPPDKGLPKAVIGDAKRKYHPSEDWLYIKMYAGQHTIQSIIKIYLQPLIEEIKALVSLEKWFFIRYTDPYPHLRIRLKINPDQQTKIMSLIRNKLHELLETDNLWKITIDTYHRELERYGAGFIDAAESLFHFDSSFVISCYAGIEFSEELTLLTSMRVFDFYLKAFGLSLAERHRFTDKVRLDFSKEFQANKLHRLHFSKQYRDLKAKIAAYFESSENSMLEALFEEYRNNVEKTILATTEKTEDVNSAIISLLHMHANRFFQSSNRKYEYNVYALLEQKYKYELGSAVYLKNKNDETISNN